MSAVRLLRGRTDPGWQIRQYVQTREYSRVRLARIDRRLTTTDGTRWQYSRLHGWQATR